jgi:hypothetical protein
MSPSGAATTTLLPPAGATASGAAVSGAAVSGAATTTLLPPAGAAFHAAFLRRPEEGRLQKGIRGSGIGRNVGSARAVGATKMAAPPR